QWPMSASDRSWTIAPAVLWFAGTLVVALCVFDGGVGALADRFSARREPAPPPVAGPTFAARPVVVAEAPDSSGPPTAAGGPATPGTGKTHFSDLQPGQPVAADRSKIMVLEDFCLDGMPASCKRWAMDGFYRAIEQAKAGKLGRAVRIS